MGPTTHYASFLSVMGTPDPEDIVRGYMSDAVDEYDVEAAVSDYRAGLNELLPGSLVLVGDAFIGLVGDDDVPDYWQELVNELAEDIDLEELIERHRVKV